MRPGRQRAWAGALGVWCFLLLTCSLASGSTWQVYDQGSGLPSSKTTAFAVFQTQMAVGTLQGVGLYDGESMTWTVPPLPPEIGSAAIRDLVFDDNGGLWMATAQGLAFLPAESERTRDENLAMRQRNVVLYGVEDGLPNVDVERIQIADGLVFAGCFGGFVCRCQVPSSGKGTFQPLNYFAGQTDEGALKIRSVGITGLAMKNSTDGWFSTQGSGLVKVSGVSMSFLDQNEGMGSDWIETFWIFPGESRSEHILAATGDGLTLIRDERVIGKAAFPREKVWLTSLVAFKDEQEEVRKELTKTDDELKAFLRGRSLWVGTKNDGLWRFADAEWTQFLPETSRLPSPIVNRLYRVGGRLVVCTDAGLVIVPLNSQKYDEFKNKDLGRVSAKTIYPFPDRAKAQVPINHISRKNDFWVASAKGLSRFVSASGLFQSMLDDDTGVLNKRFDTAGLRETEATEKVENRSEGDAPIALSGERIWDFFTKDSILDPERDYPLPSNTITRLVADDAGFAWMIFEENQLSRLKMNPQPKKSDQQGERVEKPGWYHFTQAAPWPGGTKLTGLWFAEGKLYVGTKSEGFFVLKNPGYTGETLAEWEWQRFGMLEGLANRHVIGFCFRQTSGAEPTLVVLHPDGVTLYDGKEFLPFDLGGGTLRRYRCVVGDPLGNLWLGSDAGVIRVNPEWKVTTYTAGTCFFESDRITALALGSEGKAAGVALWVACDQSEEGSDLSPLVATLTDSLGAPVLDANGKVVKVVKEADVDGSSLHFFDGLVWEKWKVPGVRCMMHEGDFLWMGTNLRMRRLFIPLLLP